MASMTVPSGASAAASAADAAAEKKPKMKKRKGPTMIAARNLQKLQILPLRRWKDFSLIENRVLRNDWMDLARDGPDRPAYIVLRYSAPLAEELCEVTSVKHALNKILQQQQSKKLACLSPPLPISGRSSVLLTCIDLYCSPACALWQ